MCSFYYSLDGKDWKSIGRPVKMIFDYTRVFMGSKFAIFNYATKQLGGYVDIDSFDYNDLTSGHPFYSMSLTVKHRFLFTHY